MREMLLINASPRVKGTSFMLLQLCQGYLEDKGHKTELIHLYPSFKNKDELWKNIQNADTIIFCGPCYINTYPADTIAFFEELSKQKELLKGQSVYGMIQGGMPYAHSHESGLSLIEMFCKRCNMSYRGGFVMGLGAMLNGQSVDKLPNSKSVIKQLNIFFDHIAKDEGSPQVVYQRAQFKLPSFVFALMTKKMNQTIDKDLRNHGIDVNQKSPYLESNENK
jgi:hypothetical protein